MVIGMGALRLFRARRQQGALHLFQAREWMPSCGKGARLAARGSRLGPLAAAGAGFAAARLGRTVDKHVAPKLLKRVAKFTHPNKAHRKYQVCIKQMGAPFGCNPSDLGARVGHPPLHDWAPFDIYIYI